MKYLLDSFGAFIVFWVIIGGFWMGIDNQITVKNISWSASIAMLFQLGIIKLNDQ